MLSTVPRLPKGMELLQAEESLFGGFQNYYKAMWGREKQELKYWHKP